MTIKTTRLKSTQAPKVEALDLSSQMNGKTQTFSLPRKVHDFDRHYIVWNSTVYHNDATHNYYSISNDGLSVTTHFSAAPQGGTGHTLQLVVDMAGDSTDNVPTKAEVEGLINAEATAREEADAAISNKLNQTANSLSSLTGAVEAEIEQRKVADAAEAEAREAADIELQKQIDAIESASDVVDVINSHKDLDKYDTSSLKDNDIIKVLKDEEHNDAISYYRYQKNSKIFDYIGSVGPYVTPAELDDKIDGVVDGKQDKLIDGETIKTINGESILGPGNLEIQGGGGEPAVDRSARKGLFSHQPLLFALNEDEDFSFKTKNTIKMSFDVMSDSFKKGDYLMYSPSWNSTIEKLASIMPEIICVKVKQVKDTRWEAGAWEYYAIPTDMDSTEWNAFANDKQLYDIGACATPGFIGGEMETRISLQTWGESTEAAETVTPYGNGVKITSIDPLKVGYFEFGEMKKEVEANLYDFVVLYTKDGIKVYEIGDDFQWHERDILDDDGKKIDNTFYIDATHYVDEDPMARDGSKEHPYRYLHELGYRTKLLAPILNKLGAEVNVKAVDGNTINLICEDDGTDYMTEEVRTNFLDTVVFTDGGYRYGNNLSCNLWVTNCTFKTLRSMITQTQVDLTDRWLGVNLMSSHVDYFEIPSGNVCPGLHMESSTIDEYHGEGGVARLSLYGGSKIIKTRYYRDIYMNPAAGKNSMSLTDYCGNNYLLNIKSNTSASGTPTLKLYTQHKGTFTINGTFSGRLSIDSSPMEIFDNTDTSEIQLSYDKPIMLFYSGTNTPKTLTSGKDGAKVIVFDDMANNITNNSKAKLVVLGNGGIETALAQLNDGKGV